MGGDVNVPVGTEIEVGQKVKLGLGYEGYLIVNPFTGETRVAEATTGAIIGPSIEEVRKDIKTGSSEKMVEQMHWATGVVTDKKVEIVSAEDFWGKPE